MTNTCKIPIKYKGIINEHIEIECEIWDANNSYNRIFDLVIDTGATMSGISQNVAMQLGYDPSDPLYFNDFNTAAGIVKELPVIEVSMINVHGIKLKKPKVHMWVYRIRFPSCL